MLNMTRFPKPLLIAIFIYPSWLVMMTLHECGHVLHALLSGGRVIYLTIPLLGFSRTDVSPNPAPLFVAAGGPLWGCIFPYIMLGVYRLFSRHQPAFFLRLFAGFCCIANGAYIGTGAIMPVGDAKMLRSHGAPAWTLAVFGIIAIGLGLWEWHRVNLPLISAALPTEPSPSQTPPPNPPTSPA